jgi:hypothetical protein
MQLIDKFMICQKPAKNPSAKTCQKPLGKNLPKTCQKSSKKPPGFNKTLTQKS